MSGNLERKVIKAVIFMVKVYLFVGLSRSLFEEGEHKSTRLVDI